METKKITTARGLLILGGLMSAVLLLASTISTTTEAQSQQRDTAQDSILLTPTNKRYTLNAGQKVTDEIKIINNGDNAYSFTVYGRPYSVKNEKYEPDFVTKASNSDAHTWVKFGQTRYQADPGETVTVPYTMTVPKDAAPGGHYGVLFAETQPPENSNESVVRKKRVGAIIYANVNGNIIKEGSVRSMDIPFWQTQSPISATALMGNSGNIDYQTKATFAVKDLFGRVKFAYVNEYTILPKSDRLIEIKWDKAPRFGLFNAEVKLEYLDKKETKSGLVLIMPQWLPLVLVLILTAGGIAAVIKNRRS